MQSSKNFNIQTCVVHVCSERIGELYLSRFFSVFPDSSLVAAVGMVIYKSSIWPTEIPHWASASFHMHSVLQPLSNSYSQLVRLTSLDFLHLSQNSDPLYFRIALKYYSCWMSDGVGGSSYRRSISSSLSLYRTVSEASSSLFFLKKLLPLIKV